MSVPNKVPSTITVDVYELRYLEPFEDGTTTERRWAYPSLESVRTLNAGIVPWCLVEVLAGGLVIARRWPDWVPHGPNMSDWDPKEREWRAKTGTERAEWARAEMAKMLGEEPKEKAT